MNTLLGTATSASMRYLLSINLGPLVGLTARQAIVFNALDMIISSLATSLLKKMEESADKQIIFGRGLGFIASLTISSLALGRINLAVALVVSGVSQFAGLFVNLFLTSEREDPLGIL